MENNLIVSFIDHNCAICAEQPTSNFVFQVCTPITLKPDWIVVPRTGAQGSLGWSSVAWWQSVRRFASDEQCRTTGALHCTPSKTRSPHDS